MNCSNISIQILRLKLTILRILLISGMLLSVTSQGNEFYSSESAEPEGNGEVKNELSHFSPGKISHNLSFSFINHKEIETAIGFSDLLERKSTLSTLTYSAYIPSEGNLRSFFHASFGHGKNGKLKVFDPSPPSEAKSVLSSAKIKRFDYDIQYRLGWELGVKTNSMKLRIIPMFGFALQNMEETYETPELTNFMRQRFTKNVHIIPASLLVLAPLNHGVTLAADLKTSMFLSKTNYHYVSQFLDDEKSDLNSEEKERWGKHYQGAVSVYYKKISLSLSYATFLLEEKGDFSSLESALEHNNKRKSQSVFLNFGYVF